MDLNWKLAQLSKALKQTSENRGSNAAVVLLLRVVDQDLQVLFVKRAKDPTDTWSGQTAFPGGKREPKDFDIKATVVRETFEEIHLNLLEDYLFLGTMKLLKSVEKPELKILPFVFLQKKEQTIKLNVELTEYFWSSLRELDHHKGTAKFRLGEFPTYNIGKHVIWGLTYRILYNLLSTLSVIEKEKPRDN
ncbi:NUDIX hydrolase [Thermoproteota archaeon]